MNTDRLFAVGIALCCIFALGTAASTLGSSVSTDPDEVVDVDYRSLPIEPDAAGELKRQAQTSRTERSAGSSAAADQQGSVQQSNSVDSQVRQSSRETLSSLDGDLRGLLAWLLDRLRFLIGLLTFAVAVVVGTRLRDRLLDRGVDRNGQSDGGDAPLDPSPSNEVERAWWTMVERTDVDDARTKTPQECADDAVASGADEDAVATLTRTFEAVRYGGASVTDDRVARVQRDVEEVGG